MHNLISFLLHSFTAFCEITNEKKLQKDTYTSKLVMCLFHIRIPQIILSLAELWCSTSCFETVLELSPDRFFLDITGFFEVSQKI